MKKTILIGAIALAGCLHQLSAMEAKRPRTWDEEELEAPFQKKSRLSLEDEFKSLALLEGGSYPAEYESTLRLGTDIPLDLKCFVSHDAKGRHTVRWSEKEALIYKANGSYYGKIDLASDKKHTLNPNWENQLNFYVYDENGKQVLNRSLYTFDDTGRFMILGDYFLYELTEEGPQQLDLSSIVMQNKDIMDLAQQWAPHYGNRISLSFLPGGRYLIGQGEFYFIIIDLSTYQVELTSRDIERLGIDSDYNEGAGLAVQDFKVEKNSVILHTNGYGFVYNFSTKNIQTLGDGKDGSTENREAWSPNGNYIVNSNPGGFGDAIVWDVTGKDARMVATLRHDLNAGNPEAFEQENPEEAYKIFWGSDNKTIVTVSSKDTLRVWSLENVSSDFICSPVYEEKNWNTDSEISTYPNSPHIWVKLNNTLRLLGVQGKEVKSYTYETPIDDIVSDSQGKYFWISTEGADGNLILYDQNLEYIKNFFEELKDYDDRYLVTYRAQDRSLLLREYNGKIVHKIECGNKPSGIDLTEHALIFTVDGRHKSFYFDSIVKLGLDERKKFKANLSNLPPEIKRLIYQLCIFKKFKSFIFEGERLVRSEQHSTLLDGRPLWEDPEFIGTLRDYVRAGKGHIEISNNRSFNLNNDQLSFTHGALSEKYLVVNWGNQIVMIDPKAGVLSQLVLDDMVLALSKTDDPSVFNIALAQGKIGVLKIERDEGGKIRGGISKLLQFDFLEGEQRIKKLTMVPKMVKGNLVPSWYVLTGLQKLWSCSEFGSEQIASGVVSYDVVRNTKGEYIFGYCNEEGNLIINNETRHPIPCIDDTQKNTNVRDFTIDKFQVEATPLANNTTELKNHIFSVLCKAKYLTMDGVVTQVNYESTQ